MGKFDVNGGYFAPEGYFRINEGGSHEENPNGGVQVGVDQNGTPNVLEEGEPVYKDFVFSDNISADAEVLKQFNIPAKYAGKLYSEIADAFVDEAEERPNDPISNNGLNVMLNRIADAQEYQKQMDLEKQLEEEMSQLSPEELRRLEMMLSQQEGGQQEISPEEASMQEQAMMQGQPSPEEQMMAQQQMGGQPSPEEQAMMAGQQGMPMMAYGGTLLRSYAPGGPKGPVKRKSYPVDWNNNPFLSEADRRVKQLGPFGGPYPKPEIWMPEGNAEEDPSLLTTIGDAIRYTIGLPERKPEPQRNYDYLKYENVKDLADGGYINKFAIGGNTETDPPEKISLLSSSDQRRAMLNNSQPSVQRDATRTSTPVVDLGSVEERVKSQEYAENEARKVVEKELSELDAKKRGYNLTAMSSSASAAEKMNANYQASKIQDQIDALNDAATYSDAYQLTKEAHDAREEALNNTIGDNGSLRYRIGNALGIISPSDIVGDIPVTYWNTDDPAWKESHPEIVQPVGGLGALEYAMPGTGVLTKSGKAARGAKTLWRSLGNLFRSSEKANAKFIADMSKEMHEISKGEGIVSNASKVLAEREKAAENIRKARALIKESRQGLKNTVNAARKRAAEKTLTAQKQKYYDNVFANNQKIINDQEKVIKESKRILAGLPENVKYRSGWYKTTNTLFDPTYQFRRGYNISRGNGHGFWRSMGNGALRGVPGAMPWYDVWMAEPGFMGFNIADNERGHNSGVLGNAKRLFKKGKVSNSDWGVDTDSNVYSRAMGGPINTYLDGGDLIRILRKYESGQPLNRDEQEILDQYNAQKAQQERAVARAKVAEQIRKNQIASAYNGNAVYTYDNGNIQATVPTILSGEEPYLGTNVPGHLYRASEGEGDAVSTPTYTTASTSGNTRRVVNGTPGQVPMLPIDKGRRWYTYRPGDRIDWNAGVSGVDQTRIYDTLSTEDNNLEPGYRVRPDRPRNASASNASGATSTAKSMRAPLGDLVQPVNKPSSVIGYNSWLEDSLVASELDKSRRRLEEKWARTPASDNAGSAGTTTNGNTGTGSGNGNGDALGVNWARYPWLTAATTMYNAFMPADKYRMRSYNPVLTQGQMDLVDPTYIPIDERFATNNYMANNAHTVWGLMNSGAGHTTSQNLLANDYNAGKTIGDILTSVQLANAKNRNDVITKRNTNGKMLGDFNYGINSHNVGILNDAELRNIQNSILQQRLNYAAQEDKFNAIGKGLGTIEDSIMKDARERDIFNMINSNKALNYGYSDRRGTSGYKRPDGTYAKYGGTLLRKCKK